MLTAVSQLKAVVEQSTSNQRVTQALATHAREVSSSLSEGLRIVREEIKREQEETIARAKTSEATVLNSLTRFGEVIEEVFGKVSTYFVPSSYYPP